MRLANILTSACEHNGCVCMYTYNTLCVFAIAYSAQDRVAFRTDEIECVQLRPTRFNIHFKKQNKKQS